MRLLIPYPVMSLIYLPLKLWMNSYAIKAYELKDAWRILIGDSPNTAMWFLYILFLCTLVCTLIARREKREPLQYITGEAYFMGLRLKTAPYSQGKISPSLVYVQQISLRFPMTNQQ